MAITPQTFPGRVQRRSSSWIIWIILLVVVAAVLYLGRGWFFDAILSFLGITPPPAETALVQAIKLPDLSIFDKAEFRELRRFDSLPFPSVTSTRRTNPFAPF